MRVEDYALARTLHPEVRPPTLFERLSILGFRAVAPSTIFAERGCERCDGCRYVTWESPEGHMNSLLRRRCRIIEEPWHVYLQRHPNLPPHRRLGRRPCPWCNWDGNKPFREPFSGVEDVPAMSRAA